MQACRELERARAQHLCLKSLVLCNYLARCSFDCIVIFIYPATACQRSDTLGHLREFLSFSDLTHNVLSATGSPSNAIDAAMHHA